MKMAGRDGLPNQQQNRREICDVADKAYGAVGFHWWQLAIARTFKLPFSETRVKASWRIDSIAGEFSMGKALVKAIRAFRR